MPYSLILMYSSWQSTVFYMRFTVARFRPLRTTIIREPDTID